MYELTEEYRQLLEMMEDDTVDPEVLQDTLEAEEAEIPMETETQAYKDHINGYPGYPQGSTPAGDGFMNIPDGIDEELPFN